MSVHVCVCVCVPVSVSVFVYVSVSMSVSVRVSIYALQKIIFVVAAFLSTRCSDWLFVPVRFYFSRASTKLNFRPDSVAKMWVECLNSTVVKQQ